MLSASIGITIVLSFLLLATQVAAHLLATTRLRADAAHAARVAASAASTQGGTAAIDAAVAREVDELRSRYGSGDPHVDWRRDGSDWLVVTVSADSPARLAGAVDLFGLERIEATSRVRVEVPR